MSFLNNILGYAGSVNLRSFSIGSFTLDAVAEETYQRTVTKTESAVETGAKISDHRIVHPVGIVIRGTVVNYELPKPPIRHYSEVETLLDVIPLPISVSVVTDQIRHTVNKFTNIFNKAKSVNRISNFLPNTINDFSATDDRVTQIKNTIEALQDSDEFLEVMTSTGVYKNITVDGVSVIRNDHGSAEFQIYLSEVMTYDVEVVEGINAVVKAPAPAAGAATKKPEAKPQGAVKSDRPAVQSSKPQNKGNTQPQKRKESAIVSIRKSVLGR